MIEKVYITQEDNKKRNIGTYDTEKNLFLSVRSYSRHFMRKYQGYGLDKKVLVDLVSKNSRIVIFDEELNIRYETTAKIFWNKKIENHYWKHNTQCFMSILYFDERKG